MHLRYTTIGIVVCLLQAAVLLNANSHSPNQDSDYFVGPIENIEKTSGLVYVGRYHPQQHPDNWKWITLGEYSVRYRGKVIIFIYRDYSDFQRRRKPTHHHRNAFGLTLESWRIDTRPLCNCYKCIAARPRLQKLSLHRDSLHYVIYYRGHVELHPVKPKTNAKPKPNRKVKQLEEHSRKSHTRNEKREFEPRNRKSQRKKERRRPCGVSSHQ